MDYKRFNKYFAQKPPVAAYAIGFGLIVIGAVIVIIQGGLYRALSYYVGVPLAVIGLLIVAITKGIIIPDSEADKQLSELLDSVMDRFYENFKLSAREKSIEPVQFKSSIYEDPQAKLKRGSNKIYRSSEYGAGAVLLATTKLCILYKTASLVEEKKQTFLFETEFSEITDVSYVAGEYDTTMKLIVSAGGNSIMMIVPNDAIMDDLYEKIKNRTPLRNS